MERFPVQNQCREIVFVTGNHESDRVIRKEMEAAGVDAHTVAVAAAAAGEELEEGRRRRRRRRREGGGEGGEGGGEGGEGGERGGEGGEGGEGGGREEGGGIKIHAWTEKKIMEIGRAHV